ncbi:glycoside hydrolase [Phlyctochytrium arcticum]|nr:glycoside hydrolase [Phlyctochytrium arcticum]
MANSNFRHPKYLPTTATSKNLGNMARYGRHVRFALTVLAAILFLSSFRTFLGSHGPSEGRQDPDDLVADEELLAERRLAYGGPRRQLPLIPRPVQPAPTKGSASDPGSRGVVTEVRLKDGLGYPFPAFLTDNRDQADEEKLKVVREMMSFAWDKYIEIGPGADEIRPEAKIPHNWYGGSSFLSTPVDSLDTLHIMGLTSRYKVAKQMVLDKLNYEIDTHINVFETTIRVLGGLLAAYELDGDDRLLALAKQLGDKLIGVFDTPTGLPIGHWNMKKGNPEGPMGSTVNLAEIGTLQVEFQYLSDVTGDPKYAEKALKVYDVLHDTPHPVKGLYKIDHNTNSLPDNTTPASEQYGIGAASDSFYEYLLKVWLSTGIEKYREWYDESAQAINKHLVRTSDEGRNTYVPNASNPRSGDFMSSHQFHHLTCFAGGMFATGALTRRREGWTELLDLGKRITHTCWQSYSRTETGLGPESMDGSNLNGIDSRYILRPETTESIFYMWRFTHDPIYREMGWAMVQSLNTYARLENGFAGLRNVNDKTRKGGDDLQQSFFMAETLKYLYLLFESDDVIPLEAYVFNTEAHPLSMRGWGKRRGMVRGDVVSGRKVGSPPPLNKPASPPLSAPSPPVVAPIPIPKPKSLAEGEPIVGGIAKQA